MAIAVKSDNAVQQDVLAELTWDPRIEPNEVGVAVEDRVVSLTGTVDTYAKKVAAEKAAHRVEGVRAVANDLSVRTSATWNDADIATAAANALAVNTSVPKGVDVTVNNGKVTLTGQVDWDYQRRAAVFCVEHVAGVRDVLDRISLKPRPASAFEVKQGIERALIRDAEIDAKQIDVSVTGGHVHLSGQADSWSEKLAAGSAAWMASGVTDVINDIEVTAY